MLTYAAIPLTCWLCALLSIPRRPLPNHHDQELAFCRLVARQQMLLILAVIMTLVFMLVLLLNVTNAALARTPS